MVTTGEGKFTRVVQLLDLEEHTRPLGHTEHDHELGERCYARLPYDFPGMIRVMRIFDHLRKGRKDHSLTLRKRTLEIDLHTFGVKVWIAAAPQSQKLQIFIEDEEGRNLVASYEKEDK